MDVLIFGIGIFIGSFLGSFLGYLCTKKRFNEEIYDVGFAFGYDVAKGDFYNPQAKG